MSKLLPYKQARAIVREFKLQSSDEFIQWAKVKPPQAQYVNRKGMTLPYYIKGIPKSPSFTYTHQESWISWDDFLGVKRKKPKWIPYEQAREFARSLNLSSLAEWDKWYDKHKPKNIPKSEIVYIEQGTWVSWSDFLGTWRINSVIKKKMQYPVTVSRLHVHKLYLTTRAQYFKWWKENRPYTMPYEPHAVYKQHGWAGWADFLGTSIYSRMQVMSHNISVLYIAYYNHYPQNVFKIAIESKGLQEVSDNLEKTNGRLIKAFEYDAAQLNALKRIMQMHCTYWWDGVSNEYVVTNVYQLINDLNIIFLQTNNNTIMY